MSSNHNITRQETIVGKIYITEHILEGYKNLKYMTKIIM